MKQPNERDVRENEMHDWETFQQKLVELLTKIGKRALPWTRQLRVGSDCHPRAKRETSNVVL